MTRLAARNFPDSRLPFFAVFSISILHNQLSINQSGKIIDLPGFDWYERRLVAERRLEFRDSRFGIRRSWVPMAADERTDVVLIGLVRGIR